MNCKIDAAGLLLVSDPAAYSTGVARDVSGGWTYTDP